MEVRNLNTSVETKKTASGAGEGPSATDDDDRVTHILHAEFDLF